MRLRREGLRRNDRTPNEIKRRPSKPLKENFETSLPMSCLAKSTTLLRGLLPIPTSVLRTLHFPRT